MELLKQSSYAEVQAKYTQGHSFFPLIGSVLEAKQEGCVFSDGLETPTAFYVEHAFGFAQVIGEPTPRFSSELNRYWLKERVFASQKIRLYTPVELNFLKEHGRCTTELSAAISPT